MSSGFKKSLIALSVSGMLASSAAYATNGYFAHGYSTKEKGLAGAGVAYSQDALASATNPAGLINVGERMDIGAGLFNPNRKYTASSYTGCLECFPTSPGTYESSHDVFLIPHFGYTMKLDETSVFGIAAYGNGGMNTDYENVPYTPNPVTSGTYAAGAAGVDLAQLFINASYAKKINDDHSVGASLIFAYQTFKAHGLGAFGANGYSTDPNNLTDRGDDSSSGFGGKVGWQGKVAPAVTLGASYQTKMAMSEFDKYKGLFAEQGDFDIPATLILGGAWDINDTSKLLVDVQTIYYSDVSSIANGIQPLLTSCNAGTQAGCLGADGGAGFGWDDMTVIKVGYQWMVDDMTMRVGISNGDNPISGAAPAPAPTDSQVMFNILAPGVVETHLTFGLTKPLGSNAEFSFSAMYAPSNDVTGSTQFDPSQTVKLEMDQMEVQGTYTMKF